MLFVNDVDNCGEWAPKKFKSSFFVMIIMKKKKKNCLVVRYAAQPYQI